jgi:hypothetical protein
MNESQKRATIWGRLFGFGFSIYFWFFLNNLYDHPIKFQSMAAAIIEDNQDNVLIAVLVIFAISIIIIGICGALSRALFSFK